MSTRSIGENSDGYHTFNELYQHRHALFLSLMATQKHFAWMSNFHDDGSAIAGWFIAGISLPQGMVTYHMPDTLWQAALDTGCKPVAKAPKWDGHKPADVVERLMGFAKGSVLVIDLEKSMWEQIKEAAASGNMPEGYMMNDWVSDVCRYLRGAK